MGSANCSAPMSCPQTSSDAEVADMTVTWRDSFLPPSHCSLPFLLFSSSHPLLPLLFTGSPWCNPF